MTICVTVAGIFEHSAAFTDIVTCIVKASVSIRLVKFIEKSYRATVAAAFNTYAREEGE